MDNRISRRSLVRSIGLGLGSLAVGGHSLVALARPNGILAEKGGLPETVSERIADFIVSTRFEDLPPAVVQKAKAQVAYHFGLAFSGSFNLEANQMRRLARQIQQTNGGATVIGERFKLLPSDAAFANTTLFRALWRDDVVSPASVHPGIVTLPATLAIAEVRHRPGNEMLLALVLGYEVIGKLGSAAYGWGAPMPRRPTMIYGGYAPVTAAGRLLELDYERMANAIGYAAHLGMGVPGGGQMDHFYSFISRKGTLSALLAEVGGEVYGRRSIEGKLGLFDSFFGEVPAKLESVIEKLGSDWEILRAEYKPYHGTGANSVVIKLMLDMAAAYKLTPDRVMRIDVFVPDARKGRKENFFAGPFTKARQAYSSMPYAVSVALLDGDVSSERYTDAAIRDKEVNALVRKVNIHFESGHRNARYYRLRIYTTDGRKLEREADRFEFPFPPSEWDGWLHKDGHRMFSGKRLRRIKQTIANLEELDDASTLMAMLVPDKQNIQR